MFLKGDYSTPSVYSCTNMCTLFTNNSWAFIEEGVYLLEGGRRHRFCSTKKNYRFFSASSSGFGGEREEAYSKKILRVRTLLCCCFCFVLFVLLYIRQRRECHEKENINLGNFQALFKWYNLIMKSMSSKSRFQHKSTETIKCVLVFSIGAKAMPWSEISLTISF